MSVTLVVPCADMVDCTAERMAVADLHKEAPSASGAAPESAMNTQ